MSRLADLLADYGDDLAAAAAAADDEAVADAHDVLAALSRGESPPKDAARRLLNRAGGS